MIHPFRPASKSGPILSWFLLAVTLNMLYTSSIPAKFHQVIWNELSPSAIPVEIPAVEPDSSMQDYQLAMEQSYGFFQDITESNWKRLQQIAIEYQPHLYPEDPLKFTDTARRGSTPAWYQTNYEPDFSCQFERRIGGNSNGDGPKWVCDPHRITQKYQEREQQAKMLNQQLPGEKCLVYSIGSNGDFQFETGLQKMLGSGICEIHIFDIDDYSQEMEEWAKKENVTDLYFHQWGLTTAAAAAGNATGDEIAVASPTSDTNHTFRSVGDIVASLGHTNREQIDIFKIDCESCEWDTFEEWLDPVTMPRLQQILIELHRSPPTKVLPFFDTLRAKGYVTFHKEPNIQHSQGNCIEYAFLKLAPAFFQKGSN